ncbi:hypothetical protein L7F22_004395 [Adiantum nelumboides]|nr:hypothetical protein [Adiantum nelumboides]
MTYEMARNAFLARFQQVEDSQKVWQAIQSLVQGESQTIEDFVKEFNELWTKWCTSLGAEVLPSMLKKDRFLASLRSGLRLKVELKQPRIFEVAIEFAKNKEWKAQCLSQLGFKIEPNIEVKVVEQPRILTKDPGHDQQVAHDVDTFQKEMQEVVGLMKNLSVHMMGGGTGQGYGYGCGYGSNECFAGGRGRGMAGRGDMFQCYNCGEAGPSGLTAEEKGKTKVVNIIQLDKGKDDINAMVMPVGKKTTREQENSDASPSHKRGKQAEIGTGKEKKKRKPRRHYNTSDFPLGEGQPNYNLRADLVGRKADVTFGQLMETCPRLKRQWKRMVNPMKNEPTKGSVRVLSLNELPDICLTIDAWHKRKCIGEAYIDGGAQDWGHGTITLYNRSGDKKKFDMATDEDDDDAEYSSSEEDNGEESNELDGSSEDDSDAEVSSLFLEEEKGQKQATLCLMENEDTSDPYEQIEGLMQPRVQLNVKDELIQKILSPDLTSHEKGVYLHILQQFPNLYITSYEEIGGFKGEKINIPIKEGAQPVQDWLLVRDSCNWLGSGSRLVSNSGSGLVSGLQFYLWFLDYCCLVLVLDWLAVQLSGSGYWLALSGLVSCLVLSRLLVSCLVLVTG